MKHRFSKAERQRGGQTTAALTGAYTCPRCKRKYTRHCEYAGHLGLHGFADKYTNGDMQAAARKFNLLGIAAGDPFPANGAFARAHEAAREVQSKKGA